MSQKVKGKVKDGGEVDQITQANEIKITKKSCMQKQLTVLLINR